MEKERILGLMKKHVVGVLATVAENGVSEAAPVEFAETDSCEIIFDTSTNYRKYKNLLVNPKVAFVIGGNEGENQAVQYEGVARELTGAEKEHYKKIYFAKVSDAEKWGAFPETVYFVITPTWVRHLDYNTSPPTVFEITF